MQPATRRSATAVGFEVLCTPREDYISSPLYKALRSSASQKRLRDLEILVGDIMDRNCNQPGNFYAQNRLERLKTPLVLFRETTHRGKVDVRVRDSMSAWNISVDAKFLPPLGPRSLPSYSRLGKLRAAEVARGGEVARW